MRAGMFMELVANPIPKTRAAGFPTNLATRASNFLWTSRVPVVAGVTHKATDAKRAIKTELPKFRKLINIPSSLAGLHVPAP